MQEPQAIHGLQKAVVKGCVNIKIQEQLSLQADQGTHIYICAISHIMRGRVHLCSLMAQDHFIEVQSLLPKNTTKILRSDKSEGSERALKKNSPTSEQKGSCFQ